MLVPPGENVGSAPDATDCKFAERTREVRTVDIPRGSPLRNLEEFGYLGKTRKLVRRHFQAGYVGDRT
jgi:hypothetical protein